MGMPSSEPRIKRHIADLRGRKYGLLTPIQFIEVRKGIAYWLCKCECGKEVIKAAKLLKNGHTTTCGDVALHHTMHGQSKTRLFSIWQDMKNRCNNPNIKNYRIYGARGITVCAEWNESFESFRNWATANGYSDNLTIDRKDSNGNYEPENCRWATKAEQSNNRRVCRFITINGVAMTASEWGKKSGISGRLIIERLNLGWSGEALLSPPNPNRKKFRKEKIDEVTAFC